MIPPKTQRVVASGAGCAAGAKTAAATTNEAAAYGFEGPISKQAAAAADAGTLDGLTSASATDAGREAAVAGWEAKTTDTTTADTATAAATGGRGGPRPLEPLSAQPKHDPVRGTTHEPVAGHGEEQQREAQLQDEA